MKNSQKIKVLLRSFIFPVLNLLKYKKTYWYSPSQENNSFGKVKVLTPTGRKFSECTTGLFSHKSNWEDAKIVEVEYTNLDKFFWIHFGKIHSK